jgi:hypothetical protein
VSDLALQARAQGINIADFNDHWVVLDRAQQVGNGCMYYGLALVGRVALPGGNTGGQFIMTSIPDGLFKLQVWQHEYGHTIGLDHSGSVLSGSFVEYGDSSCALGSTGRVRCFNIAQSTILGWNKPQYTVDINSIPNQWVTYTIKAPRTGRQSGFQITSQNGGQLNNWFISYRPNSPSKYLDESSNSNSPYNNDYGVDPSLSKRVHVHTVPGPMQPSYQKTVLLASLDPGYAAYDPSSRIVFYHVQRANSVRVTIALCRKQQDSDC